MSATDLTLSELEAKILRGLGEGTTGSEAFPQALIWDTVNELYEEVFNQPNTQFKIRTDEHEFDTVADTALNGDVAVGALSIVLDDSSKFPASGMILIDNELIAYTANNLTTTLTCAAGAVKSKHDDGAVVRKCYALPSGIDSENVQGLIIDGITYDPADVAKMLSSYEDDSRNFAIYESYLILPENSDVLGAILFYTPSLTEMDDGLEKPTLIPNSFRVPLLVNGAIGKLKMADGQRDYARYYRPPEQRGDKGGGMFFDSLKRFYAIHGRGAVTRNKKSSNSIYD